MVTKTEKIYKRRSREWGRGYAIDSTRVERVKRETWWLLFVPVYSRVTIISTNA